MPGMNSGVNVNDPTVVAAFKAALGHQGLIALLIFGMLALAWVSVRVWLPAGAGQASGPVAAGARVRAQAEPDWKVVHRHGDNEPEAAAGP